MLVKRILKKVYLQKIILENISQFFFPQSFLVRLEYFMILFRVAPAYPILSEGAILSTHTKKKCFYVKGESVSIF